MIDLTKINIVDPNYISTLRSFVSENCCIKISDQAMREMQRYYCNVYYKKDTKTLSNIMDEHNNSLIHYFCGWVRFKNGYSCVPFYDQSYIAKIAFSELKFLPWYQKIPSKSSPWPQHKSFCDEYNTLFTFLISMQIPGELDNPERVNDFLPTLQETFNPRFFLSYFNELKDTRNSIFDDKRFNQIFTWLDDIGKKDIEKHGFYMQQNLQNYLLKIMFKK